MMKSSHTERSTGCIIFSDCVFLFLLFLFVICGLRWKNLRRSSEWGGCGGVVGEGLWGVAAALMTAYSTCRHASSCYFCSAGKIICCDEEDTNTSRLLCRRTHISAAQICSRTRTEPRILKEHNLLLDPLSPSVFLSLQRRSRNATLAEILGSVLVRLGV